ncbi:MULTISPECIES: HIRAN domain-containing protein [Micrococcaceae]|uniref:HIRAN domain-containing protein n=1 Tax=Micrococcaceae TaxID=1268 RepID=UPI0011783032|nr:MULTISPECIES: HIRAN domain-containing protein [Micrococcaceae]
MEQAPAPVSGHRWSYPLLGQTWGDSYDAAGGWAYPDHVRMILNRPFTKEGIAADVEGILVDEPFNPHDKHAVAIFCEGLIVGYLPRIVARDHAETVRELRRLGWAPTISVGLWGALRTDTGDARGKALSPSRTVSNVRIGVPGYGEETVPANDLPGPCLLIPGGRGQSLAKFGRDEVQLRKFTTKFGRRCTLFTELFPGLGGPLKRDRCLRATIGDEDIGILTIQATSELEPYLGEGSRVAIQAQFDGSVTGAGVYVSFNGLAFSDAEPVKYASRSSQYPQEPHLVKSFDELQRPERFVTSG